jgi:uncharacterized tellurite resistance protein B-like protein
VLFDRLVAEIDDGARPQSKVTPQTELATAVLLFSVIPADYKIRPEECRQFRFELEHLLNVGDHRCNRLISRSVSLWQTEASIFPAATLMKRAMPATFCKRVLESCNRLAVVDGHLHDYEKDLLLRMEKLLQG